MNKTNDIKLMFKNYLEKIEQQPNYIDILQDELGIDPNVFANNPEWAASVSLGSINYNGIIYKIVKIVRNGDQITGAIVKPLNVSGAMKPRAYMGMGSKAMRLPNSDLNTDEIFWPKSKLKVILTQGMGSGSPTAGRLPGGM